VAYAVSPSPPLNRTPTANDDESKGFLVGSSAIDATASPPVLYICTDNTMGAARWIAAGGVYLQSNGADEGHVYAINFLTGVVTTTHGVATYVPPSGWARSSAFVALSGQSFFPVVGVSEDAGRHAVTRNGLLMLVGAQNDYTVETNGVRFTYPLEEGTIVQVLD
jgi:hypothetical protein